MQIMEIRSLRVYLFCIMQVGILYLLAGYGYAQQAPVGRIRAISLVVLPFENKTSNPDQNWIGEGLAISLADKISHVQDMSVVDRQAMQESLKSGAISKLATSDEAEAKSIGQKFESRFVIWGYYKVSSDISLVINLTDTLVGGVTKSWKKEFAPNDILKVQPDILKSVLAGLDTKLEADKEKLIFNTDTKSPEAYKNYILAYLTFINERADAALDMLKPILKANPNYGPAILLSIRIDEETNRWEELPALYQKYETILTTHGDLDALNALYDKITDLYINDKKYREALAYYQKKMELAQKKGDLKLVAQIYTKIANTCFEIKEQENAITNYQKALDVQKKLSDQTGIANTYQNIADVYLAKGLDVTALKNYQKALEIWRVLNRKDEMGISYNKIGQAYLSRQEYATAQKYLSLALEMQQATNDQTLLSIVYTSLGNLNLMQLSYDQAMDYYQKALNIQEHANAWLQMINTYENMATIYIRRKQTDKAIVVYQRELKVQMELGQKKQIAATYSKLGQISYDKQNYDGALEYFDKARGFTQIAGGGPELDDIYIALGHIYKAKGNLGLALKNYQKSLEGQRLKNNESGQMEVFYQISTVYDNLSQPEKAVNYLERAVALAQKSGSDSLANYRTYLAQLKQKAAVRPAPPAKEITEPETVPKKVAAPPPPEQPVNPEPNASNPPPVF